MYILRPIFQGELIEKIRLITITVWALEKGEKSQK